MELDKVTRTAKLVDPESDELDEYLAHGWKIMLTCSPLESAEGGAFYGNIGVFYLGWLGDAEPWYPEPAPTEELYF